MKSFHGSCHCKAINFSFLPESGKIEEGMRCNCSLCRRKGILLSNFVVEPKNIEIGDSEGFLNCYQFATGVARHYFCSNCGIAPFVQTRLNPGCYRVNLGCVEGIESLSLKEIFYDGTQL